MKKRKILSLLMLLTGMACMVSCSKKDVAPPSIVGTWTAVSEREISTMNNVVISDTTYYYPAGYTLTLMQDLTFTSLPLSPGSGGTYAVQGNSITFIRPGLPSIRTTDTITKVSEHQMLFQNSFTTKTNPPTITTATATYTR